MKSAITVRLDEDLDVLLERVAEQSGLSKSDVVRDALRRRLSVLAFQRIREQVLPFAEARGYLTDEDVFRDVS